MSFYIGTQSDCEDQERLHDRMYALPKGGINIGEGIHVPMPAAWSGRRNSPGWTSFQGRVLKHPTLTNFAIELVPDGDRGLLTPSELIRLDGRKAVAVTTLPADWIGAKPINGIAAMRASK